MKSTVFVVVCLLVALPARGQDLKLANAVYSAGMVTDWITTYQAKGNREANPIARPFVDTDNPILLATGAALDVGLQVGINRLLKNHRRWAQVVLIGGGLARGWIGYSNVQAKRALEARRRPGRPVVYLGGFDTGCCHPGVPK